MLKPRAGAVTRRRRTGHDLSKSPSLTFKLTCTCFLFVCVYIGILSMFFSTSDEIGSGTGPQHKHVDKYEFVNGIFESAKLDFSRQEKENEAALRKRLASRATPQKEKALRKRPAPQVIPPKIIKKQSPGFMVLGMHRSGTSMLSGMLVIGMGYAVGEPLIGQNYDNKKGFFERVDAVLQNDEFFRKQKMSWNANVIHYDYKLALQHKESKEVNFNEGDRALGFLNDASNAPYLQKDPRMCITLKTWLPLLNHEPAVVFTYRHPLDVANSLTRRAILEDWFLPVSTGLRLWIVYNMRAIQNSRGLCRVFSANEDILKNPMEEVQRISDELTSKCNVMAPAKRVTMQDVNAFVDPTLQHNKERKEQERTNILKGYGNCEVLEYNGSEWAKNQVEKDLEIKLYLKAMTFFCDMKSSVAYEPNYEGWELPR